MKKLLVALALLCFPMCAAHIYVLKHLERPTNESSFPWTKIDALPVWDGSRMLLHRTNPYSDAATTQIQRDYYGRPLTKYEIRKGDNPMGFAYPPYTAFVCAWLAALPWKAASVFMLIACFAFTVASVPMWVRITGAHTNLPLTVAVVLFSFPALWGIRLEQLSMIVIPAIALACWLYLRGHYAISGVLLALCTVKPQLCFLLAAWLLLRSWSRERRGFILSFCGAIAALCLASEIWLPGCFGAWFGAVRYYRAYTHVYLAFPYLAVAVTLLAGIALVREREFGKSVALVLAATIVIAPTDPWTIYNYLLLVPAVLLADNTLALAFVALEYLIPAALVIGQLFVPHWSVDVSLAGRNTLLPIALTAAVASRAFQRSRVAVTQVVATE